MRSAPRGPRPDWTRRILPPFEGTKPWSKSPQQSPGRSGEASCQTWIISWHTMVIYPMFYTNPCMYIIIVYICIYNYTYRIIILIVYIYFLVDGGVEICTPRLHNCLEIRLLSCRNWCLCSHGSWYFLCRLATRESPVSAFQRTGGSRLRALFIDHPKLELRRSWECIHPRMFYNGQSTRIPYNGNYNPS